MGKYDIVVCLDHNLFDQMLVLFQSAVCNCKRNVSFHILQSDFTDYQRKELFEYAKKIYPNEIKLYNINPDDFDMFYSNERYPVQTYYYLLAQQLLPDSLDRVLYMDCDTYIRKDIAEFYDMNFEDNYFIGSKANINLTIEAYKKQNQKYCIGKSLFNSGIMLLNLSKMRNDKIDLNYFKKRIDEIGIDTYFADQGLLNYCFWNKIKLVSPYIGNYITAWANIYFNVYGECDTEKYPLMVHFTGPGSCKPWNSIIDYNDCGTLKIEYYSCKNETHNHIQEYYKEWILTSNLLSPMCHNRILKSAYKKVIQKNSMEKWMINAKNFFEKLAYDQIYENKFDDWVKNNKDKSFSILKCNDAAGKYFVEKLKKCNIKINFKSSKGLLRELSAQEFETAKKADIIVMCCVHTPVDYDEFNGVKAININTIFKL